MSQINFVEHRVLFWRETVIVSVPVSSQVQSKRYCLVQTIRLNFTLISLGFCISLYSRGPSTRNISAASVIKGSADSSLMPFE